MAEESLSTQSHTVQLVDTVPAHLQLPISRSHVCPRSVRTEPQVVNVQIDPTNQGIDLTVNLIGESQILQT